MPKGYPNAKSDNLAGPTTYLGIPEPNPLQIVETTVQEMDDIAAMRAELQAAQAELSGLKAKVERRAEIAEVVTEAMMGERRKAFGKPSAPEKFVMPEPNGEKLIKMTLDHHYAPTGFYEVVGYNQEEVVKKRADGSTIVVTAAAFIPDVVKPHHIGGVGFQNKIWAGTVLKVQETEARLMRKNGIASYELD